MATHPPDITSTSVLNMLAPFVRVAKWLFAPKKRGVLHAFSRPVLCCFESREAPNLSPTHLGSIRYGKQPPALKQAELVEEIERPRSVEASGKLLVTIQASQGQDSGLYSLFGQGYYVDTVSTDAKREAPRAQVTWGISLRSDPLPRQDWKDGHPLNLTFEVFGNGMSLTYKGTLYLPADARFVGVAVPLRDERDSHNEVGIVTSIVITTFEHIAGPHWKV